MHPGIKEAQLEFGYVKEWLGKKKSVLRTNSRVEPPLVFNWNLSYERLILSGIGMVIVLVLAFSLGVERGKRLPVHSSNPDTTPAVVPAKPPPATGEITQLARLPSEVASPVRGQQVRVSQGEERIPPVRQQTETLSQPAPGEKPFYTIQVVTVSNQRQAEQVKVLLKSKGFDPFIRKSGKYIVVCTGKYSNKDHAKSSEGFKKLRRLYDDCFVRRVT